MTSFPLQVQPGDLITSELMNAVLDEVTSLRIALETLQGQVPGTVIVPSVFGRTLFEARTTITQPSQQLALGSVFDVSGTLVDPTSTTVRTARVLNQVPTAGARVAAGSSVNLVISAASTGPGPGPAPAPTITRLLAPDGTPTTRFAVGTGMIIEGNNFDSQSSNNAVTFAGRAATVTPSTDDPTHKIYVTVPSGIPGAPTASGQSDLTGVSVVVRNAVSGQQASTTCTIAPPPAVPPPHISSIPLGPHLVGSSVTITGTGFSSQAEQNVVKFDTVQAATPSAASATSLTVTVPSGISGLNQSGDVRTVNVTLKVSGVDADAPYPTEVERP